MDATKMQLSDREVKMDRTGWYMSQNDGSLYVRRGQSGGHAEGLRLTGVVGG